MYKRFLVWLHSLWGRSGPLLADRARRLNRAMEQRLGPPGLLLRRLGPAALRALQILLLYVAQPLTVMWDALGAVVAWLLRQLLPAARWVWTRTAPARAVLARELEPVIWPLQRWLTPIVQRWARRNQQRITVWRAQLRHRYQPRWEAARDAVVAFAPVAFRELRAWPRYELDRFLAWLGTSRWQNTAMAAMFFLAVAFWVTSPAWLLGPTRTLVGGGENPDWTGTAWAYWWTGYALRHGMNPFNGTWDFFPVGQRPVGQYNLLDGVLGAPMMGLFGPTMGYNAFATFTVWSSGLAMYALARSAGVSQGASVLAGVALITSNFFGFELRDGRISQTLLMFWILGLAGLERMSRGLGTWRLAVATGIAVGITHLIYWYNGLFLVIAAMSFWVIALASKEQRRFVMLGLAILTTLAMTLPYVFSLAQHYKYLPGVSREMESWMNYGELGRNEFGLSSAIRHSHWPGWPLIHPFGEPDDHRVPLAVLALGLGGLFFRGRGRAGWVCMMLVGYVFTLGPYLKGHDDQPTPIRLPYLFFYDHVPFFDRLWWPGRMALIFLVPLMVLAALHLDRIAARWPRWRMWILAAGTASTLIDADVRNPFFPIMGREPETYNADLYEQIDGPIITTPVLGQDPAGRHHLWFQIFHKQPILYGLGAHISAHRPYGYEAYIKANSLLLALAHVSENEQADTWVTKADVDKLIADGFRWAVVDPTTYTFDYAAAYYRNFSQVFYLLWGPPDVVAGYGLAWRVRPIQSTVFIPPMPAAGPSEYGKAPVLPTEDEDDDD